MNRGIQSQVPPPPSAGTSGAVQLKHGAATMTVAVLAEHGGTQYMVPMSSSTLSDLEMGRQIHVRPARAAWITCPQEAEPGLQALREPLGPPWQPQGPWQPLAGPLGP